jgi:copper resistance protein B
MKRLILLLAATALAASPAVAQHQDHNMPDMTMPVPANKAPAKKSLAKKAPAKKHKKTTVKKVPAGESSPVQEKADPHAGHSMPAEPTPADPHAAHQMPAQPSASDPHAGQIMPAVPAEEHAGHDASATVADVPVGPPPAEALQGPENAADTAWGRGAMEHGRAVLFAEHGRMLGSKVLIDQLETQFQDGRNGYFLNAEGWYGGDIDKLWLKTEVEGEFGDKPEQAEIQALWSHAINPWFDLQAGVRLDAEPDTRGHLVLGVQGLAPYWWEVDGALFLSNKGEVTARAEAEYDLRITQKLILQPRGEIDLSLQDIPELGIGAGLSEAAVGARLRYQITPLFAPYVGVEYERAFGDSADFRRNEGEDAGGFNLLAGVRVWF